MVFFQADFTPFSLFLGHSRPVFCSEITMSKPLTHTTASVVLACVLSSTWQQLHVNATPNIPAAEHTPTWEVKGAPDGAKKFCGFHMATEAEGVVTTTVYHATKEIGAYNHAAMLGCVVPRAS